MTSGTCSKCGQFSFSLFKPHCCPPLWVVRVAEDSDYYDGDEAAGIHARDAVQAAEKFGEQWDYDELLMGKSIVVEVTAAGDSDTIQKFTVMGELVPRYWATLAP